MGANKIIFSTIAKFVTIETVNIFRITVQDPISHLQEINVGFRVAAKTILNIIAKFAIRKTVTIFLKLSLIRLCLARYNS